MDPRGTDTWIIFRIDSIAINATLVFTWVVMALLVIGARFITLRLSSGPDLSNWQNLLEVLVIGIRDQIQEVSRQDPGIFLPFVGSLFLFIACANLLGMVPGFVSPTGSLSTTTALAICVFVAVPVFGISQQGLPGYLRHYVQPSVFMLPFNVIGELSRTLALAVRLYGNIMSGTVLVGLLLSLAPFFFPVLMQLLGLLTGMIQAYIFAVLAMVYIASAASAGGGTGPDVSTGKQAVKNEYLDEHLHDDDVRSAASADVPAEGARRASVTDHDGRGQRPDSPQEP
ncbi:MAG: F0F1 ATP synthase subunit A [Gammaproteobacteria bacterium]|nr:F0F1 ATP synthase subunit A [Gammaproteobacteria bacterium]